MKALREIAAKIAAEDFSVVKAEEVVSIVKSDYETYVLSGDNRVMENTEFHEPFGLLNLNLFRNGPWSIFADRSMIVSKATSGTLNYQEVSKDFGPYNLTYFERCK